VDTQDPAIVPEPGQGALSAVRPIVRDPRRTVPLGRIVDAWGVRGWVKVEPFAGAGDTALLRASVWHLQRPAAPAHAPIDRWLTLERSRRHASTVVAKPEGVEDRTGALALKGAEVGVRRMDFPPLPEGEVYWVDLEGCAVVNPAGESFGTVVSVDDHGAHPIIETNTGHLIPFVDAYVVDAVPAEGRIVVDWQADWSR